MVDVRKVEYLNQQVGYGRGQGMKAALLAFLLMGVVLGGLFLTDPLNFVTTHTQSFNDCRTFWAGTSFEKLVCDKNYMTTLYLNWFAFFLYLWLSFSAFFFALMFFGWGYYPKQAAKDLARNLIIYGEKQAMGGVKCNCPPEKHKHKEKP